MKRSEYEVLKIKTKNISLLWKEARGIAPDNVADKMDDAMLSWILELTDCLSIWLDKGEEMTAGELILARTNMGALVESWLKFFYCVHYNDYLGALLKNKNKTKDIEPNNMTFDQLKKFSEGRIWDTKTDAMYIWVNKIQQYRNAEYFSLKEPAS